MCVLRVKKSRVKNQDVQMCKYENVQMIYFFLTPGSEFLTLFFRYLKASSPVMSIPVINK